MNKKRVRASSSESRFQGMKPRHVGTGREEALARDFAVEPTEGLDGRRRHQPKSKCPRWRASVSDRNRDFSRSVAVAEF
jgi:hypothetical protein